MIEAKVRVTQNYQVTIPAEIRKRVGIMVGDVLRVTLDESSGKIIFEKMREERKRMKIGRN
ncbi:MAG: AbrB/MazE/SpoVT family DNA-binding domain-containing protein [Candidatus Baldrarchaeia archaeon]